MSNSSLATYTLISPNKNSPRNHKIDTITIHCFVGQVTAKRGCEVFQPSSKKASCNYVVGYDGSIGLCVEEKDRRLVYLQLPTTTAPLPLRRPARTRPPTRSRRRPMPRCWTCCDGYLPPERGQKLALVRGTRRRPLPMPPSPGEMVMTVHRWFANKSCPGDYLYNLHGEIAAEVTKRLGGSSSTTSPSTGTGASGSAQTAVNYTVKVTATDLNIRSGPGTNYGSKGAITPGVYTIVAEAGGTGASKWGKLKSGAGWISLDYATKNGTSSSTASKAVTVGSTVTIQAGAVYGGLATSRGAKVPDYVSGKNRRYTVKQIATHKGVQGGASQKGNHVLGCAVLPDRGIICAWNCFFGITPPESGGDYGETPPFGTGE